MRDTVSARQRASDWAAEIADVFDDAISAVNDYFQRALTTIPSIGQYLASVAATHAEAVEG